MTNIPTELLRTLVAVVDFRSFTRAAQALGVTQPAVSAQIKRLQSLIRTDLLDKSAPGVSLTTAGELVVDYARKLLSINDQILDLAAPRPAAKTIRIGVTGDFATGAISFGLAFCRLQSPDLRFVVNTGYVDVLLKELREGSVDLVVWVSATGPTIPTPHYWTEPLVWLRSASTRIEPSEPVPLVGYGDECVFTRSAITALSDSNRSCELVYVGSGIAGLAAAVTAGFGVMVLPRSRADIPGLTIWDDAPLPKLPDVFGGIYVRTGADPERELVADAIAAALRTPSRGGAQIVQGPAVAAAAP
jgi:DNA-binding transcriptional LysR family regulator